MEHAGACHCRRTSFVLESAAGLAPRACQCAFCRKHGARSITDPNGIARLKLGPETIRYRFGSGTTDFLICSRCGVYVAAVTEIDGALFATLNLNAFDDPRLDLVAQPVCYDGENVEAKAERRRRRWTPARIA